VSNAGTSQRDDAGGRAAGQEARASAAGGHGTARRAAWQRPFRAGAPRRVVRRSAVYSAHSGTHTYSRQEHGTAPARGSSTARSAAPRPPPSSRRSHPVPGA
jgi:hypothetical protein